jgi:hypothetical protein
MEKQDCRLISILRFLRHFIFLLPAAIAVLLYTFLPNLPGFTETVISKYIFRIVSIPIGFITSLLPFSITEICAILALPATVTLLVLFIRSLVRSKNRVKTSLRAGKIVGWVLSIALLLYIILHGANFYRQTASDIMNLNTSPKSAELLQQLCIDLAKRASLERENLKEDSNGISVLSQSLSKTLSQAGDGYKTLQKDYPFLWGAVNRAKPVQLSHWWSYTGITGMYFPFTVEANVNIDQPDLDIPATAAHEIAHTRGFAREDECNFYACLSCFVSPSVDYRYSGTLMAYVYCSNALYAYDTEMWSDAYKHLSDGVKRDIAERGRYWKQFEGKVQKTAEKVNDSFIQSQGVDDGVLSYNRVVELLLAFYEKEGLPK